MKKTEKRNNKGYKATDSDYKKAMKRAKKEKVNLATLIEVFIMCYGTKTPFSISEDIVNIAMVTLTDGRIIVCDKSLARSMKSSPLNLDNHKK